MIDMQALIDGMSAQWQRERSDTQMTLGKFIAALEKLTPETRVNCSSELRSYRGYYSDLSIAPGATTAGELLKACQSAMGRVFGGYKGGDFMMGENTPLWIAYYGSGGDRVMSIGDDGQITTAPDDTV